jgi:integrase
MSRNDEAEPIMGSRLEAAEHEKNIEKGKNRKAESGIKLFRCVCRAGTVWGDGMTEKMVWHVVKMHAKKLEMPKLAPHDLRRSCARFCHAAGGELEQIQFLLSHVSVQTTERYLGCKQRFREAVNDRMGIEPMQ